MVIDVGETEILKRQLPQSLYSVVDVNIAAPHLFQELSNFARIH
jgi:hypothetical protein